MLKLFLTIIGILWASIVAQGQLNEPVCEGLSDYFPDVNCSVFYHCANGYPELEGCPDGLYWNIHLNTCDFPINVPECVGGTRAPLLTTTTTELTTTIETTTTDTITTLSTTTPTTSTTTTTPQPIGCGGILTAESGVISYKETSNYENNERCVWTVAVPRATHYTFDVDSYSGLDLNDGIFITQLEYSPVYFFHPTFHTHQLNSAGGSCDANGNVAIVIFYTNGDTVTTGFRMNYTSRVRSTNHGSHVIASSRPSQIVTHPESGSYTNEEMSTFVYSPAFSYNANANVQSTFTVRGMEACCDFVYAYSFDYRGSNVPLWKFEAVLGSYNTTTTAITTSDIVLFVFESDSSTVGAGFTLSFQG